MVVYDDQDVIIIAPYQLKLQDAEVDPQHWVFFKCISNHPITGDPLPYARGLVEVSNGIFCRKDVSAYGGALFTAGDPNVDNGCGGGAVLMGHAFERTDDPPRICLTDFALGERYRTLYITAGESKYVGADAVLANMKLKKLTATDGAKLNAVAIGLDEYGDIPYEYESIQLNTFHNLRFCFGTNERMVLENTGILRLPVNGPSGGLKIGNDVTLYRSDQDVLKTDDNLIVGGSNLNINPPSGSSSLSLQIGGSTKAYFTHDGSKGYLSANGDLEINISGSNIRVMGSKYLLPENPNGGSIGNGTYYWGSINSNYMCLVGNQKYVYPLTANTGSCGTIGNYFYSTYANHFYGKQSHLFGCEIEKSDLPIERKFQTFESAEECLRHELTKEWKHTHYSESKPGKIICVCGKEADTPCPEHVDEWNDIYTLNLSDMTQASAMLVVKLLDEVADLRSQIDLLKSGEVKVD